MKRNELEVGKEYAYVTAQEGKYNLYADKVTIVSTEPHEYDRYRGVIRQVPSGQTVLVSMMYKFGGEEPKPMNKVVQLRHLVEEWEPYTKRVKEAKAERAELNKKIQARQDYRKNVVEPKVEKLVAMLKNNTQAPISRYMSIVDLDESVIDYLMEIIKFHEDYR